MESDVIFSLPRMLSREEAKIIADSRTCHHLYEEALPWTRETEGRIVILTFPPGYINTFKAYARRDKMVLRRKEKEKERSRDSIILVCDSNYRKLLNYGYNFLKYEKYYLNY